MHWYKAANNAIIMHIIGYQFWLTTLILIALVKKGEIDGFTNHTEIMDDSYVDGSVYEPPTSLFCIDCLWHLKLRNRETVGLDFFWNYFLIGTAPPCTAKVIFGSSGPIFWKQTWRSQILAHGRGRVSRSLWSRSDGRGGGRSKRSGTRLWMAEH